jgi:hypothetical protein
LIRYYEQAAEANREMAKKVEVEFVQQGSDYVITAVK